MTAIFLLLIFLYIKIAERFAIIDKPNERSSHTQPTIRGGGIIFPIAWCAYAFYNGFIYPWFTAGLMLVALISFIDDIKPIAARYRFLAHGVGFILLFQELDLLNALPIWGLLLWLVVGIGIVNAFNFMDGINGITGFYSLSIMLPILYYNGLGTGHSVNFLIPALLAFGFFNFRKKARCFAGDIGSVSLGFIVVFLLSQLIFGMETHQLPAAEGGAFQPVFILFLLIYGVDSILTIAQRLMNRENIFQAHRKHLYQYLSNEMKWPHLLVASLYGGIQLALNFWISSSNVSFFTGLSICLALGLIYLAVKRIIATKIKASQGV